MAMLAPAAAVGAGGLSSGLSLATTLIGGVVSAVGAMQQGQAAAQAHEYQAAIAERNAENERENAKRARDAAAIEQQQADLETSQLLGAQLAAQSVSGVDIGRGSPLGARKAARVIGRRDALNIRHAGEIEAFNSEVDATGFDMNAAASRSAGRNALTAGRLGAFTSLIGTARNISSLGARRIGAA